MKGRGRPPRGSREFGMDFRLVSTLTSPVFPSPVAAFEIGVPLRGFWGTRGCNALNCDWQACVLLLGRPRGEGVDSRGALTTGR